MHNINESTTNQFVYPSEIKTNLEYGKNIISRVVRASLPILKAYQPLSMPIKAIQGGERTFAVLISIRKSFGNGKKTEVARGLAQLVLVISMVSLSILAPTVGLIAIKSSELASRLCNLKQQLLQKDYKAAGRELFLIANSGLTIASLIYATPELMAISFFVQALAKLEKAYNHFAKGEYIEGVANLVLVGIKLNLAAPHIQTVHRNWFGKELTQEELDQIVDEFNQECHKNLAFKPDFESALKKHGISSNIKGLNFIKNLSNYKFKNINFKDCDFSYSNLSNTAFIKSSFKDCNLSNAFMIDALFEKTSFSDCNLDNAVACWASFKAVEFNDCNLSRLSFNEANIINSIFRKCRLSEACFFDAKVSHSEILDTDLTNCLLLETRGSFQLTDCTENKITKPLIGLSWNFEAPKAFASIIKEAVEEAGGIVFRFHHEPRGVDTTRLDSEVKDAINTIGLSTHSPESPIPQAILAQGKEGSEIERINQNTAKIGKHLHGLIMPGGDDLHPEFYGKELDVQAGTYPDENYVRSIFEFALVNQATKQEIPIHGICRGGQLLNVFFGGTLKQHVEGHSGEMHYLAMDSANINPSIAKTAEEILGGKNIFGLSFHHQAADKLGKDLVTVLEHEGSPEMVINEKGNVVITQFHPEGYMFPSYASTLDRNKNFFKYMIAKASTKI